MALFTPPIGFFGKLPAYPDFVRQNAGGPLARALDDWIHEGVAQMNIQGGEEFKNKFDGAGAMNFLFHVDDPSKYLIGVFAPSRDKSGRRYLFSLFANTSPGKSGQHVHLLAEAYSVFLKATNRLIGDLENVTGELRSGKVSALATTLPQNLYDCDRRFERLLELKKMSDFWTETVGSSTEPVKYLVMKNLLSALGPLRDRDLRKFELCLALPISSHASVQGSHVGLWLGFCRQVLKRPLNSIVAFWDAARDTEGARLYLFFRPPGPRFLSGLLNPAAAGDVIWDMATLGADKIGEAREKLAPGLAQLLDNPELSAGAFLKALAQ